MEQPITPQLLEFRSLAAEIRKESALLLETALCDEEEQEENKILGAFASVIETQVFSTLVNLSIYQLTGWRELIND